MPIGMYYFFGETLLTKTVKFFENIINSINYDSFSELSV